MRIGNRWPGRALASTLAACCWLAACGDSESDLFGNPGTGGAAGSAAGAGGSDAGAVDGAAGSSLGGASQGGSGPGGSAGQGGSGPGGSAGQGGGGPGGSAGQGGGGPGGSAGQGGSGFGGSSGNCPFTDSADHDGDSWSFVDGDCNDCDAMVNPGAFDGSGAVGLAGVDDDCDGTADNAVTECDMGWAIDDPNPFNAAQAIGLCSQTSSAATGKDKRWGVLTARYTKIDGSPGMAPASHGLMPAFGAAKAQQGSSLLVLSSGTARTPSQPGYIAPSDSQMGTQGVAPGGFPAASTLCPGITPSSEIHDPAALEVDLRVPTNARGFGFMLNLYTYEYPDYACSQFNDVFVVLANPAPPGAKNANLAFDPLGNTLGANCSLLQVCVPKTLDGGSSFACPLGTALLAGTGFEANGTVSAHAATGWLRTTSPVTPGSLVTVRFAIADVGDAIFSSTVLIDRFEWSAPVASPATQPVANPL